LRFLSSNRLFIHAATGVDKLRRGKDDGTGVSPAEEDKHFDVNMV